MKQLQTTKSSQAPLCSTFALVGLAPLQAPEGVSRVYIGLHCLSPARVEMQEASLDYVLVFVKLLYLQWRFSPWSKHVWSYLSCVKYQVERKRTASICIKRLVKLTDLTGSQWLKTSGGFRWACSIWGECVPRISPVSMLAEFLHHFPSFRFV